MVLKKFKASYLFIYVLNCMRAFKFIRSKEGEKEIFKELHLIQSIPLCLYEDIMNKDFQRAISEKIFQESLDSGLASAVMLARYGYKKSIIMPYPKAWRNHLKNIGLKQHWLSFIFFIIAIFRKLKEAIVEVKKLWLYSFPIPNSFENYVSFIGVPLNALTRSKKLLKLDNFLSYAEKNFNKNKLIFVGSIGQNINARSIVNIYPFLPIQNKLQKIKFMIAAIKNIVFSVSLGLIGRWHYLYMLKDEIISQYIKLLRVDELPKKIIFLNSCYIYKPLWTQRLEQREIEISLMFYSTNSYNIQFNDGEYGIVSGYKHMSWKHYYTFHKNHKLFIKEVTKNTVNITLVPEVINLCDSDLPLNLPKASNVIVLFDVQPFREIFLATIGRPTNIYSYNVSKLIVDHILEWCKKNEILLIIKPKRDVNKRLCPYYAKMLKNIQSCKWCVILDSSYSPKTICAAADIVVCQPFTSAALSAVNINKPVVYYDPTGTIKEHQPACQEILLLNSKKKLYNFFESNIVKHA